MPFTSSYAHIVEMVWFGFVFAVVSPICTLIAVSGMVLFYFYEKALFNSKYSIPIYLGPRLNSTLIDLLDYTALLIGTFNLFLYTTSNGLRNAEN